MDRNGLKSIQTVFCYAVVSINTRTRGQLKCRFREVIKTRSGKAFRLRPFTAVKPGEVAQLVRAQDSYPPVGGRGFKKMAESESYCTYVLYSRRFGKIYVGQTSNLIGRFHHHNALGKKGYTLRFRPWEVIYVEFHSSRWLAQNRERQLKSAQGRLWIRRMIEEWL